MAAALIFIGLAIWLFAFGYCWDSKHPAAQAFIGVSMFILICAGLALLVMALGAF